MMRIATTLLLGAAVLAGASAASLAQDGFKPVPAVAPLPSKAEPKAEPKAAIKQAAVTPPAVGPAVRPAMDVPPSAERMRTRIFPEL